MTKDENNYQRISEPINKSRVLEKSTPDPMAKQVLQNSNLFPHILNRSILRGKMPAKKIFTVKELLIILFFVSFFAAPYLFNQWYFAPERIVAKAVEKTSRLTSFNYNGEVGLKFRAESLLKSAQLQKIGLASDFFPNTYKIRFQGSVNLPNGSPPEYSSIITLDSGLVNVADLEMKVIDNAFYIKLLKLLDAGSLGVDNITDKWFILDLAKLDNDSLQKITLDSFSDQDKMRLLSIFKKTPILRIVKKLPDDTIDGDKTYRFRFFVDKKNIEKVIDEYFKVNESDIDNGKILNIKEILRETTFEDGEIWINKKDYYIRKINFVSVFSKNTLGTKVEMQTSILLNNFNIVTPVNRPVNAEPFKLPPTRF